MEAFKTMMMKMRSPTCITHDRGLIKYEVLLLSAIAPLGLGLRDLGCDDNL